MPLNVDILGTQYKIIYSDPKADKMLSDCDGYIDRTVKKIVICDSSEDSEVSDREWNKRLSLRHEIVHAFMLESGLAYNMEHKPIGIEETMVDWIAIQFPKMLQAFESVGCL
jgi:hypothetical protein